MTASQIIRLLLVKHQDEIAETECVTGSKKFEYGSGDGRFDLWVAACSWSKPLYIGYEVKVSRRDFLNDNKWPRYLNSCNQFYFVTAPGVATKDEIPEACGWIEASKTGSRLFTRKKAPHSEVSRECVYNIFKNLAMRGRGEKTLDYWRSWLAQRQDEREIGHRVAASLRNKYDRDVREVENRVIAAEALAEKAEKFQRIVAELNISTWELENPEILKQRVLRNINPVNPTFIRSLETLANTLTRMAGTLDKFNAQIVEAKTK